MQDGLGLGPKLGGCPLDAQWQNVVVAVRKLIPRRLWPCGPVPSPDLSYIPTQAQRADYLERILGRRHSPSFSSGKPPQERRIITRHLCYKA
jgi:hypothetical protein